MELRTEIDDGEFIGLITGAMDRLRSLGPAMELVGHHLLESIDETFEGEGASRGLGWMHGWRELSPFTLARKPAGRKILEGETGRLRGGIHLDEVNANSVTIAPDELPYARIQQLGGEAGRGHKVKIPARPYLALGPGDGDEISAIIADYLMRRVA